MATTTFQLQRLSDMLTKKFKDISYNRISGILAQIRGSDQALENGANGVDDADFIRSLAEDNQALQLAYDTDDTAQVSSMLSDVAADLFAKTAQTDTSYAVTSPMFGKIAFTVQPCQLVNGGCQPIPTCMVRANSWAMRGKPIALFPFNNQLAYNGLPIALVRGVYAFWIEMPGHPLAPADRVYMKLTVDDTITHKTEQLHNP